MPSNKMEMCHPYQYLPIPTCNDSTENPPSCGVMTGLTNTNSSADSYPSESRASVELIMQQILLAVFSVFSSLLIVIGLALFGWYLVWKLFLSKFKFVEELLGGMNEEPTPVHDLRNGRTRVRKTRRD